MEKKKINGSLLCIIQLLFDDYFADGISIFVGFETAVVLKWNLGVEASCLTPYSVAIFPFHELVLSSQVRCISRNIDSTAFKLNGWHVKHPN